MVPRCSGGFNGPSHRPTFVKHDRYIYVGNRKHVQFRCPICGFRILRKYTGQHLRRWRSNGGRPRRPRDPWLTPILRRLFNVRVARRRRWP
jgi:hypothetical protein